MILLIIYKPLHEVHQYLYLCFNMELSISDGMITCSGTIFTDRYGAERSNATNGNLADIKRL